MNADVAQAVADIEAHGYMVEFREWCEDPETPGLLGMYGGVTVHSRKAVKVKTHGVDDATLVGVLRHELEHVKGRSLVDDVNASDHRCGGSGSIADVLGWTATA